MIIKMYVILVLTLLVTWTLSDVASKCVDESVEFTNQTVQIGVTKVQRLDSTNTTIQEAVLDGDKPYCAKSENNSFFIQINFPNISLVTRIIVQGGIVETRKLLLYAFLLQFSYDGVEWFNYVDVQPDNPVFLVSFRANADPNKKVELKLHRPAFGRYMRLFPRWPKSNQNHDFCLRLKIFSCEEVVSPILDTSENHYASPNIPASITCLTQGQVGLLFWWKDFNQTSKTLQRQPSTRLLLTNDSTTLTLPISFKDLDSFECRETDSRSMTCTNLYTCKAKYSFSTSVWTKLTTVHVKVNLPENITSFMVAHKNMSGVILKWIEPKLNDFKRDMLQYSLFCNTTVTQYQREIPFGTVQWFVPTTLKYKIHKCSLQLQITNATKQVFSHGIQLKPSTLMFYSFSQRPNMRPNLKVVEVGSHSIKIDVEASFTTPEYGTLKKYSIKVEMKKYAESRRPELHPNLPNTLQTLILDNPANLKNYLITAKPWSEYDISVAVINNDGLYSNTTSVPVITKQGVPTAGPTLRVIFHDSKTITYTIEDVELVFQNGEVTSYKCSHSWNGNKTIRSVIKESPQPPLSFYALHPFTRYQIRCKAKTIAGFGPFGPPTFQDTDEEIPGKPSSISILPAKDTSNLLLRWSPPKPPNGNITKYELNIVLVNKTRVVLFTTPNGYKIFDVQIPTSSVNQVSIRAYTSKGYGPWERAQVTAQTTVPPPKGGGDNIVIILVFSIAIAVLIAFVVLCFVYYKRRYTTSHHVIFKDMQIQIRDQLPSEATFPDEDGDEDCLLAVEKDRERTESLDTAEQSLVDNTHDPMTVLQFEEYLNTLKQDEYEGLLEEFKNQLMSGKCYSWQIAVRPENKPKNRYTNIAAYDHSRVILHHDCKRKVPDYINANYLKGYKYTENDQGTFRYVSTQGPLENTLGDFWLMMWQENIEIIVMVSNLKETDKIKCHQYWPHTGANKYGGIIVSLQKIDKTADIITRTFTVEKVSTREQRTVLQFHFVSWPDHGAPDYPTSILSLRRRVRHYMDDSKPILVHCSAGVGRSGCFILIDAMLEQIDKEQTVNIFNYLRYMRSRRINMVQTFEQYVFAHTAILEYIIFGNTEIVVDDLDRKTRELIRGTGMRDEFSILMRNTQTDPTESNQFKVLLREGKFVNAFRVDGYKHRDAFILMKAPTEDACADFWKMVLEKQCHTIVMLNKCQESSEEYFKYWPEIDADCVYRDITISMNSEIANGNIITRKIKVTTNKHRCEVHHFQYVDWPDTDVPNRRAYSNVCTLMQAVEKSQQNLGNGPIIVHAGNDYGRSGTFSRKKVLRKTLASKISNDYGRSGTFIAIYNCVERLKVEQLIDVLQCVRAIRIAQPLAVDNVKPVNLSTGLRITVFHCCIDFDWKAYVRDTFLVKQLGSQVQYQFIYNMLRTYLEGFENYWNYKDYKVCRSPLGSTTSADGSR